VNLDDGQQVVVDHPAGRPLQVVSGFGCGASTALRARAERLTAEGRRPLLVHARDLVGLALAVLDRHGRPARRMPPPAPDDDVTATVIAFQASFLGDEELRVHCDAAGCLSLAEELITATRRHLDDLARRGLVDDGGALVQASMLLRDPDVLAAEQERFDELLVDDAQLLSFAGNRLLTQLAGPAGPIVLAGNPDAAVSPDPLASAAHLERFPKRFGATTIRLERAHRTPERPPELHLGDDVDAPGALRLGKPDVLDAVGREAATVVVEGATDGAWPAPRPAHRWFDPELFHGPDVPDDDERDRRWRHLEHRRFLVATTRATAATVVLAPPPVSPFVASLLR
jgi:hypothetical protein